MLTSTSFSASSNETPVWVLIDTAMSRLFASNPLARELSEWARADGLFFTQLAQNWDSDDGKFTNHRLVHRLHYFGCHTWHKNTFTQVWFTISKPRLYIFHVILLKPPQLDLLSSLKLLVTFLVRFDAPSESNCDEQRNKLMFFSSWIFAFAT